MKTKKIFMRTYYQKKILLIALMKLIVSQNVIDKVVNHLVARFILYPACIPCLIDTNVASRKDLGTSKGIDLAKNFRWICNRQFNTFYILKCDITKFFASIDHHSYFYVYLRGIL